MATVEDILMSKGPDVIVTGRETTVRQGVRLMAEANVGSIVIQDNARIEGIFTERDLLRRVVAAGKNPETITLGEVMTQPVRRVTLNTDVRTCQQIFQEQHLRHLAVVESNVLLGMISLRDVLTLELAEDEELLRSSANSSE